MREPLLANGRRGLVQRFRVTIARYKVIGMWALVPCPAGVLPISHDLQEMCPSVKAERWCSSVRTVCTWCPAPRAMSAGNCLSIEAGFWVQFCAGLSRQCRLLEAARVTCWQRFGSTEWLRVAISLV